MAGPDGKKMVLSCDGGGIRGILITRCLEKFERIEGRPCREIFDLMAGTSTGAIIVGALAVGLPASEISNLYLKRGREIFERACLLKRCLWWKYSKVGVRRVFREIFGDTVINDVPGDILITAKDTVRGETMFFEKKMFGRMLLREAVEASMSAPTFFQPNGRYIDGGVGSYNNPCYLAVVEAIHYLNYPRGRTRVLSFGTGREISNMKEGEPERKWKLAWLPYVIEKGMDDANEQQVHLVEREYASRGDVEFERFQISFTQEMLCKLGIPITKVKDPSVFAMDAVGYVDVLDSIARAFAEAVDFRTGKGTQLGVKPPLLKGEFVRYLKQ